MTNKKNNKYKRDELYIDKYSDQYQQIKDSLDIVDSTDSETTNIVNFRVINSLNPYPQKYTSNKIED